MLLVKSFAILGMLVIALQFIPSVCFAMHVAGAGAVIMLLLVLFCSLLILALFLALIVPPSNIELN